MIDERFAADVRNWFVDLAIGAKAMCRTIYWGDNLWEYSRTFSNPVRDNIATVSVHSLKEIAERAGFDVQHRDLVLGDSYYAVFRSEDFIMFNGVKFVDYENTLTEEEHEVRRAEEDAQREREEEENND